MAPVGRGGERRDRRLRVGELRVGGADAGEGPFLDRGCARLARTRWLVLEVAPAQAAAVAGALEELGYEEVRITQDLAQRDRVVEGRRR